MPENNLVSILIPAYKPDFFHDCLLSALNQTYPNIEIIICDDSNSNEISDIVKLFENHINFNKITYSKNDKNMGSVYNFQKAFDMSKGYYTKFLNDDDLLHETCVEKMVHYFELYKNKIVLVTSKRQKIDENSNLLPDDVSTKSPNFNRVDEFHSYINGIELGNIVLNSMVNIIGEQTTTMFIKKFLETNKPNIFSINGGEVFGNGDISMWINLLCQGDAVYIYETLSSFRIHENQDQKSPNTIYLCTKTWFYLVTETRKKGFIKDKTNYYNSINNVINLLHFTARNNNFSVEQLEEFNKLINKLLELREELEKEFYYCPVCTTYVERFIPLPPIYEEMAKKYNWIHKSEDFETINLEQYTCPNCYCSDRDRLYALYINKKIESIDTNKNYKILDFAPSEALKTFIKNKQIFKYRSADLFMDNVDDKVDITNMEIYDNSSFDCFICSHVLEHVTDDKKAIKELYRITKSGGWGILVVPIHLYLDEIYEDFTKTTPEERWKHFGQEDHVRTYSKNGFKARITEAGFSVKEYGRDYFGDETLKKSGITLKSVVYIAEKNIDFNELMKKAEEEIKLNNYIIAEDLLTKIIESDIDNIDGLFKLGVVQLKLEKYDDSIESFSQAIDLGLLNRDVFNYISIALDKIGEDELSEIYRQKAMEF